MINLIRAEWIKLYTTKSFWWTSVLILVFGMAFGGLFASLAENGAPLVSEALTSGIYPFSIIIVIIQAVMIVTTEYRFRYHTTTFLAEPRRWKVALAKYLLYMVVGALLTFIGVLLTFLVAKICAPHADFHPFSDDAARRTMWVYPVIAAMVTLFAQGAGMILRQTAGVISLVIMWILLLESVLAMVPKIGDYVQKWAPFYMLNSFANGVEAPNADLNPSQAGWYFLAWAIGMWITGLICLMKRDC